MRATKRIGGGLTRWFYAERQECIAALLPEAAVATLNEQPFTGDHRSVDVDCAAFGRNLIDGVEFPPGVV